MSDIVASGDLITPEDKKQPFDIIAAIEFDGQLHHFIDTKPRPSDVRRGTVDAITTIINAKIRHQDFQKRNTAPVRRIGMTDARPLVRPDALAIARVAFRRPRRGARRVIFRRVAQDCQFLLYRLLSHMFTICSHMTDVTASKQPGPAPQCRGARVFACGSFLGGLTRSLGLGRRGAASRSASGCSRAFSRRGRPARES